jgi:hypothetical protein
VGSVVRRLRADLDAVHPALSGPASGRAALRLLRLTAAATTAYVVADTVLPEPRPLLAPLTALLIVQATLYGTLSDSIRRVISVLVGVAIALLFSRFVGFTWWSLALLVAAATVVGVVLRLGAHLLEVPISAMLILSVSSTGSAADARISETLVGAAVGILINLVFPPALQTGTAGAAVEGFAGDLAALLDRVARDLQRHVTVEDARVWLDEANRLAQQPAALDDLVDRAEESRRLNPRAAGTLDAATNLRTSVDALEHTALSVRTMFRALADRLREQSSNRALYEEDVRQAFAVLLGDLAQAVRTFGSLVRVEAEEAGEPHPDQLAQTLESVGEARARLTELLLVDPRTEPHVWALHGALLASIERVLRELDIQDRLRERERSGVSSRTSRLREQVVGATRQAARTPRLWWPLRRQ